jgi:hypothetical protein
VRSADDGSMRSKLDPLVPSAWHEYYRVAERRRRHAGWHRRGDSKPRKRRVDAGRVLAIVMGVSTLAVILCLMLPS